MKVLIKKYLIITIAAVMVVSLIIPSSSVEAVIDCNDPRLSMNDIQFWNPCDDECADEKAQDSSSVISTSSGRNERLREAVHKYGEFAMEMQREWGTPWEVVFAQMVMESGVGTAGAAAYDAKNNWLGIRAKGDAGQTSPPGNYAIYSNVEKSIEAWAGTVVYRNGAYDEAFVHLDPNNYNIKEWFAAAIEVYAPRSDDNDPTEYSSVVFGLLDGPIKEYREEKGWPSAEELAKKENIPIGGKHPIGSDTISSDISSGSKSSNCVKSNGAVAGQLAETAINLSWPDRTHGLYDLKPEYETALEETGMKNAGCSPNGADCGVFVVTVLRASGVDPEIEPQTTNMINYMNSKPEKYELIRATDTSELVPGDIFVHHGHTFMYVGDGATDGGKSMASASCSERISDRGYDVYFSDDRGTYFIYRVKK